MKLGSKKKKKRQMMWAFSKMEKIEKQKVIFNNDSF